MVLQALKLLANISEDHTAASLQLKAQLYFRLDQGQACVDAVDQLGSLGRVAALEQKNNFLAAYISAGLSARIPELMSRLGVKPKDSYEIAFNRACALADVGDVEAAETAVKAAYKQGESRMCSTPQMVSSSTAWRQQQLQMHCAGGIVLVAPVGVYHSILFSGALPCALLYNINQLAISQFFSFFTSW